MSTGSDSGRKGGLATRRRVARSVTPPRLYVVLLHNDDYTTQQFVVAVLKSIFAKTHPEATQLMLKVHTEGVAVAGCYPHQIAETKVAQVIAEARAQEFPFLATMEPEAP